MNFLHIAGHLGADPEVRFTSGGQKVTTLRVAARSRKSSKDETIWWRVTVWGETLDKLISYLKKGSAVIVVGDMSKPEIFTGKDGTPQLSMNMTASSIMFNPFGRSDKQNDQGSSDRTNMSASIKQKDEGVVTGAQQNIDTNKFPADDEVPF
jgi:single-strand DNA-binding protein